MNPVQPQHQTVHALILPTGSVPLLVPTVTIAEIVSDLPATPIPGTFDWVTGLVCWRNRPVPVISFERLCGEPVAPPVLHQRFAVFFPLPGRPKMDYFAILINGDPRPQVIDGEIAGSSTPSPARYPFLAGTYSISGQVLGIPDFDALAEELYR